MKKKYNAYIGILCSLLVFTGCDKESVTPYTEEKVPITLSASSLPVSVDIQTQTRATETINNRSIGIVAAKATGSALSNVTSWTDYYLDHVRATGTNTDLNGEKEVAFAPLQYWPFNPGEYLAFVAYSPHYGVGGDDRVTRVGGTNTLKVTANSTESFPDFLYTEPVGSYNKVYAQNAENKAVSLGEFQHAMAKLVIKVIVVNQHGDELTDIEYNLSQAQALQISSLAIKTKATKGVFDLLSSGWTFTESEFSATAQTVYTLISTNTSLPYNKDETEAAAASTYYLLPSTTDVNTVELSEISFKVKDTSPGGIEVGGDYALDAFKQPDDTSVTLEAGKTTLLTIKVQLTAIPPITSEFQLEGQLVEWNYKGESIVEIQ